MTRQAQRIAVAGSIWLQRYSSVAEPVEKISNDTIRKSETYE